MKVKAQDKFMKEISESMERYYKTMLSEAIKEGIKKAKRDET